ncbi:hypothetical protein GUJ93_ZPchr0007g6122 [Zizania palustris]|uniref:non-specific serine/threonine protein kinase n=1 Tax=Zizania palustris TaxID=103762 RepID=A0A8J5TG33_ZIZPA|nr:hypothetical protein GUJ93_ZPchr0007g6122 [Zizania palustris]
MSLSPSSSGDEDEEYEDVDGYRKGGYHAVRPGDHFAAGRYVAQRKLGWGNFSTVWLAFDVQSQKFVALKIQKSAPEFAQAALHEIEFLSEITTRNPSNCKCTIQLIDHFKHTGPNGQHICLVFEFLGDSLLKLVQYNRYKGIGFRHLKLENILLVSTIDPSKDPIRSGLQPNLERPEGNPNGEVVLNPIEKKLKMRARRVLAKLAEKRKSAAEYARAERSLDGIDMACKIVDFGNACWADNQFTDFIQTRQYRAPEVILGSGYSFPVDMWSFACIAFELATGEMLFTPKEGQGYSEDEDHLALMMEVLGKIPKKIATNGTKSKEYFDRHGDLKRIRRLKFSSVERVLVDKYKIPESDAQEFADFLCPLFDFAPEKRPTAAQCLQHKWLQCNDDKTCGTLNITDAKNVGVACSTGNAVGSDSKSIDVTHNIGGMPDSCAERVDTKCNTSRRFVNCNAVNSDLQPNTGSIGNRNARNTDINSNTGIKSSIGSMANINARCSDVKTDMESITNRDAETIDVKPNIGTITSRGDRSSDTNSNIGSVANNDAKTIDVKPSTSSITSKDNKIGDTKSNIGSVANKDAKTIDVKPSTSSITSKDNKIGDAKSNIGSVANKDAKTIEVKPSTSSITSKDNKIGDTKSNIGSVANKDAKTIDVKPSTSSITSKDNKIGDANSNIESVTARDANATDVKRNIQSVVNTYLRNFDAKRNNGSTADSDVKHLDSKPNIGSASAANITAKSSTGSFENSDARSTMKANTGIVANSCAKNTDVQTNTESVTSSDVNDSDRKPNIGRVAASIQRLESSMGNVQIGRYR